MNGSADNRAGVAGVMPAGSTLGKYQILEQIGFGGEAVVYKAYDALLDRHVAIKQVSPNVACDERFVSRFCEVMRQLAKVDCDEIVTIHELIQDERGIFVVMEYVEGHTIETTLASQPGPVETKAVLQVIWRLAAGLSAIHRAGIIHRDIKPANIIVGEGLRVKVADFGVAAKAGSPASMRLGTTKYMAPELFGGQLVDARADIYSLGMVIYEMLLGRARFNEVFHDIVRDPHSEAIRWMKWHSSADQIAPPLDSLNPTIPPALSAIVAKMLAKDPEQRFPNVEALGREIKATFRFGGKPAPAMVGRRHRPAVINPTPGAAALLEDESGVPSPGSLEGLAPGDSGAGQAAPGPATATVPRKPLALMVKLGIAAGVLLVLLLGLLAWSIAKESQSRAGKRLAQQEYDQAELHLNAAGKASTRGEKQQSYKLAHQGFKHILEQWHQDRNLAQFTWRASIMRHIVEGYQGALGRDWNATDESVRKARAEITQVQRDWPALKEWAARADRQVGELEVYFQAQRVYVEAFGKAKAALEQGDVEGAQKLLADARASARAQEELDEVESARQDILLKQRQEEYWGHIKRADQFAADNKPNEAGAAYDQALAVLENSRSTLAANVYADLKRTAQAKRDWLAVRTRYVLAVEEAKRAEKGERLAAAKAWRAAAAVAEGLKKGLPADRVKELTALADPAVMRKRGDDVEYAYWLEQGRQHLAAGNSKSAEDALKKAKTLNDSAEVNAEIQKIQAQRDFATVMLNANRLFSERSFEAALAKYQSALKLHPTDQECKAKIQECMYLIALTEGDTARSNKEWAKALAAYQRAKAAKPAAIAEVTARIDQMKVEQGFETAMEQAEKFRAAQKWSEALAQCEAAKKLKPTSLEPDEKSKLIRYDEFMLKGNETLAAHDYVSAAAFFKQAKRYRSTPEVDALIEKAEALRKQQESGGS